MANLSDKIKNGTQPKRPYTRFDYSSRKPVDFRKQINGLSLIVQDSLQLDLFAEALFVFINQGRNRIKICIGERMAFVFG